MPSYLVTLTLKDAGGRPIEKVVQAGSYHKTGPMGRGGIEFYTDGRLTAEFTDWAGVEELTDEQLADRNRGPSIG